MYRQWFAGACFFPECAGSAVAMWVRLSLLLAYFLGHSHLGVDQEQKMLGPIRDELLNWPIYLAKNLDHPFFRRFLHRRTEMIRRSATMFCASNEGFKELGEMKCDS